MVTIFYLDGIHDLVPGVYCDSIVSLIVLKKLLKILVPPLFSDIVIYVNLGPGAKALVAVDSMVPEIGIALSLALS